MSQTFEEYKERAKKIIPSFREDVAYSAWHARDAELAAKDAEIKDLERQLAEIKMETACPDCGCATPDEAEANECGCDMPVCARDVGDGTLAVQFKSLRSRLDRAVGLLEDARKLLMYTTIATAIKDFLSESEAKNG